MAEGGFMSLPAGQLIVEFGEAGADRACRDEPKRRPCHGTWKQRLAGAQRDRADLHEHLVEEPMASAPTSLMKAG